MVMTVRDEGYFVALLENMYRALEDLNTGGYQQSPSDRFRQARNFADENRNTMHLETLIDIGAEALLMPEATRFTGSVQFHHRYNADDDSRGQARIHAAAAHVVQMLDGWHLPTGERARALRYDLSMPKPGWVLVTVQSHLFIPRG